MEASEVPQSSSPEMVEMAEENGSVAEPTEIPAASEHSSFSVPSAEENEEKDLPADFERLWLAAHENPPDFTSWTDLLQYCEQEVGDERETSSRKIHKPHCFLFLLQTFNVNSRWIHCRSDNLHCRPFRVRSQHLEEPWRPFFPAIHSAMATGKNILIWNDAQGTTTKQRR